MYPSEHVSSTLFKDDLEQVQQNIKRNVHLMKDEEIQEL